MRNLFGTVTQYAEDPAPACGDHRGVTAGRAAGSNPSESLAAAGEPDGTVAVTASPYQHRFGPPSWDAKEVPAFDQLLMVVSPKGQYRKRAQSFTARPRNALPWILEL